jgi:ProP effector
MTITKQDMHAAVTRLAECFPQTFVLEKHLPHQPLKVGIAADIPARCPDLGRRTLGVALRYYVSRVMYLQGMVTGAARIDLDGNPAGEVSAEDAEHAAARLAETLASREAKRAAAVAAKGGERGVRPPATAAPAPVAATSPRPAKVLTLKEKPVLRLAAFRRQ